MFSNHYSVATVSGVKSLRDYRKSYPCARPLAALVRPARILARYDPFVVSMATRPGRARGTRISRG